MVARSKTPADIAEALGLSVRTVSRHLDRGWPGGVAEHCPELAAPAR